jgi:hypothetical protein
MNTKKCTCCKSEKPFSDFYKSSDKYCRDGLTYYCKKCVNAKSLEWQQKNKYKYLARQREWVKNHPENVVRNARRHYKKTKDKKAGYRKQWRKRNPDYDKLWRLKNIVKVRESIGRCHKISRAKPKTRLDERMGVLMRIALKDKKNGRCWENIVGYTLEELMCHIELQFQFGMSWDNIEKWHIDHVIPRSFFIYDKPEDQEFQYCWSLHNLQPLWAKDNIAKSNKILKGAL